MTRRENRKKSNYLQLLSMLDSVQQHNDLQETNKKTSVIISNNGEPKDVEFTVT